MEEISTMPEKESSKKDMLSNLSAFSQKTRADTHVKCTMVMELSTLPI